MATMRAALYHGAERGLEIGSFRKPVPLPEDLVVKIAAAGLCASDLTLLGHKFPAPPDGYPIIPGHEATGIVESVGEKVTKFKPGDRIGFLLFYHSCGKCLACAVTPVGCQTGRVQGFSTHGFFAEYALVDERSAIILPQELGLVEAAPLFCAGVTAFHSVDRCDLEPGQSAAIVGVGGLGHLGVQYALAKGLNVVAVDVDDKKLKSAKEQGATHIFNSKNTGIDAQVKRVTDGGVDAAIVFSGSNAAYDTAVTLIRPGGTLMVVGLCEARLPLYSYVIAMGNIKVKGQNTGSPGPELEKAIAFSAKHGIVPHITTYTLDDLPEMVQKLREGNFEGRMVMVF